MARELRASLSASSDILSFALEGAAKLTEPVVGSDNTSSGENGESGSGELHFDGGRIGKEVRGSTSS